MLGFLNPKLPNVEMLSWEIGCDEGEFYNQVVGCRWNFSPPPDGEDMRCPRVGKHREKGDGR